MTQHSLSKPVYIIDGTRTPFIRAKGKPGPMTASDLSVQAIRPLLARLPILAKDIDQVIVGNAAAKASEANIARLIALRAGLPETVPAFTVHRNCASGLQSLHTAAESIAAGHSHLILAGGTEAMSHAPLLFSDEAASWLGNLQASKSFKKKLLTLLAFRPHLLKPVVSLIKGLTDPKVNLGMGQTAEEIAYLFQITRLEMDTYSVQSHMRAQTALEEKHFAEITPLFGYDGSVFEHDDGIRKDANVEKLSTLKPVFEKYGNITAANSSQITDGAAFMLLASEEAVKQHNLPVLGVFKHFSWEALSPVYMGLGPVHAMAKLLAARNMSLKDIDYMEINEAFAAQVIGCARAWQSPEYCQTHLGPQYAPETINFNTLNIDGGAIAIGHPVGASGTRLVLHLLHILKRKQAKKGLASLCIGGGQGGAVLVETA